MKKRYVMLVGILATAVAVAGCGKKRELAQQPPITATPVPESTDQGELVDMKKPSDEKNDIKNIIGNKTESAASLILTNNMRDDIASIYIRPNTEENEEEDIWGEELIQGKFVLKNGEKALYYYDKNQKDEDGNRIKSFDIRIAFEDEDKNECFFRDLPLFSITQLTLCMDGKGEDAIPYAKYLTATSKKPFSTLKEVKERLGIESEENEESSDDEQSITPTPEPTEAPDENPDPTVMPGGDGENPTEPDIQDPQPDAGAEQAKQYIGQSLDTLIGACGSPQSSDYEEDPGTGKTGYHHYDTFTVSTTVDENGNEIVAAIW